jgi:L-serine dehydratase
MDDYINSSLFAFYKVGPGPSSSHTIGPMLAGGLFLQRAGQQTFAVPPAALEVRLCGSLAATGVGHGTHRAVAGGLLQMEPTTCDTQRLNTLLNTDETYQADFGAFKVDFNRRSILFDKQAPCPKFQNTMIFRLLDAAGRTVFEMTVYSIGGGSLAVEGEEEQPQAEIMVPYRYRNMNGLLRLTGKYQLTIPQLMMENERAVSGLSEEEVHFRLDELVNRMDEAVSRGIVTEGILPGPIGLNRKAPLFYRSSLKLEQPHDRFLAQLNAWAMAVAEENAAGNRVVTAPTLGSAGVLPAVIRMLREFYDKDHTALRNGLLTAAAIGMIARRNASISGAEVGCQGEIGVASAMAAAMIAGAHAASPQIVERAAEIALEHHLGLTCDPVCGYVQIPCIERNAVGAVTAYNAYILASVGNPLYHKVSFDEVVAAMLETGRKMSPELKETSRGGLAICSLCE